MPAFTDGPPPFKMAVQKRQYEFSRYSSLSVSDAQALPMQELLDMADEECKALWDNLSLAYTECRGHPLLRDEITKFHENISADDVSVVSPQEGILIATKALASYCRETYDEDHPHVVITGPAFQSLHDDLRFFGCDVSYWPIRYSSGNGWSFEISDLKRVLQPDTKILVTNFPHNPTGYLPTEKHWKEIIQLCEERGMFLFSDEIYRFSVHDESPTLTPGCSLYDKAITLGGLSKTFGLPGLRIGWLCTRNAALMKLMDEFKDYTSICSSAPSEILAIMALRNKDALLKRVNTIIKQNLDVVTKFFEKYPELFEWHPSQACTTEFLKLKPKALELGGGNATEFCETVRKEVDLLGTPASMYNYRDDYMRIGFGRENVPEVLERFGKFLDGKLRK